jgi:hypothetical protein
MGDVKLACAETPLAWPSNVDMADVPNCTTCALSLTSINAGSLQILTRRQGAGAGDGVNIEESPTIAADFRGQRYSLDEVVFHTPGLHVFPGQTDVYPAELHIHMTTVGNPKRYVTLVIPATHKSPGPGTDWFAATAARPDPSVVRPQITTLLTPGSRTMLYMGPDIRGRTADTPSPDAICNADDERQFILVLTPANIRAMDLERIPREGSLSTDPRDLPAQRVQPSQKVPRDRLLKTAILALPGLSAPVISAAAASQGPTGTNEMVCNPLYVRDGHNVVDTKDGGTQELSALLGSVSGSGSALGSAPGSASAATKSLSAADYGLIIGGFLLSIVGIALADYVFYYLVWNKVFDDMKPVTTIKWVFYIIYLCFAAGIGTSVLYSLM